MSAEPLSAETEPAAILMAQITGAVSYLRIEVKNEQDAQPEWIQSSDLIAPSNEPDNKFSEPVLLQVVRQTGEARGFRPAQFNIALSLFVQSYAFRIASTAIAGWIITGGKHFLNVSPENSSITLGRDRPNAVALDVPGFGIGSIHDVLFAKHLGPLIDRAHQSFNTSVVNGLIPGSPRIGKKLLWGNVGSAVASTFGAFASISDNPSEVRDLADQFIAEANPQLQTSGRFELFKSRQSGPLSNPEPLWAWERASCCLLYKFEPIATAGATPRAAAKCVDCSLWTQDERDTRYEAATGAN